MALSPQRGWREYLARMAHPSWDELRTRSVQAIVKRYDAAAYRLGVQRSHKQITPVEAQEGRFFFAPEELAPRIDLLLERFPAEVDEIVRQAERICQHRFDLLGYENLDYGQEIDWHLDILNGRRAPLKPWYKVRFLDFNEVGDSKITWELNRHQHLVVLAKAYCLAREERFATELFRQWYHWQEKNPYPLGINWASSLEVAFRSLSWLWVWRLLGDSPAVPKGFHSDLLNALALNGRHIEWFLSTYFSPNTHLLGEAVGLFFIGTLCPQLAAGEGWRELGWKIILQEAQRQVRADGMHFEQSLYYDVYALDFFLHARILAASNRTEIPESFDQTLKQMLGLLAGLGQTGAVPSFGDDDGGRVFDPRRNRPRHLLDPLAIGAVIFSRGDFKDSAPGPTEEAVWLLGPDGLKQFDLLNPPPVPLRSDRFEPSGICVMAGSEPSPSQLLIDAGPQGAGAAGHGHADALSVQLSVGGRECLVDSGTFSYLWDRRERNQFRGTGAHNTLQVDGADQAEATGPFSWQSLPKVRIENWVAGESFDLFQGSHTGYCRLQEPVVHRRWIFSLKSRFWIVRDRAEGKGKHDLAVSWHLAPGFTADSVGPNCEVFRDEENAGLAFLQVQGNGWFKELSRDRVSRSYGQSEFALVVRFRVESVMPRELAVMVFPLAKDLRGSETLGELTQLGDAAADPPVRGYLYAVSGESHYFFFAAGGRRWSLGPWTSDARFLYCGIAPGGGQHWISCEASYVDIDGRRLLEIARPLARYEWTNRGGSTRISSSDNSSLGRVSEDAASHARMILSERAWDKPGERTG